MGLPGKRPKKKGKKRVTGRPHANPQRERVSQTYFKNRVNPKKYGFKIFQGWQYKDRKRVADLAHAMSEVRSGFPHLVLMDSKGNNRFTLQYRRYANKDIEIKSIQRERHHYVPDLKRGGFFLPDKRRETRESKNFQTELGGMHPTEFLISEFIWRNQKQILASNGECYLSLSEESKRSKSIYASIIERFFEKKETYDGYKLNLKKKRGRQLLGLP